MEKMVYSFLAVVCISLEIFILYEVKEIKGLVNEIVTYEVNYDLTDTSYYKQNLMSEENLQQLSNKDKYVLYFFSENCEHCVKCNEMIMAYLASEYEQYCDIYFAKYDMVPDLYDHVYSIDSTPTMLLISDSKVEIKAVGFNECFELLDKVVEDMVPKN